MARKIYSIITVNGTLEAQSPVHVGGTGFDVDSDLPLARDGQGRFYIPGTSLGGVLRDFYRRIHLSSQPSKGLSDEDPAPVKEKWGYVGAGKERQDLGHASRVIVEDSVVMEEPLEEIRDGVGIDRQWGTAAPHVKYNIAVLPQGTRFSFEMHIETTSQTDEEQQLAELAAVLHALQEHGLRVGAAVTRGLGLLKLRDTKITRRVVATREGILRTLTDNGEHLDLAKIQPAQIPSFPSLRIVIHWTPLAPVMVKAGEEGLGVDILPLVTGTGQGLKLVIPGSSIKGTLRSHAERIIRTVLDLNPPSALPSLRRFLEQVDVPLVRHLFGSARRQEQSSETNAAGHPAGKGALTVHECRVSKPLDTHVWQELLTATTDKAVLDALQGIGAGIHWDVAYHVAVDRWTGGAAQGMLYTVLEPHNAAWEPIHLELDLMRLSKGELLPAVALLLLVLRDMFAGWIPLGFATNRGLGAIEVNRVDFYLSGTVGASPEFQTLQALNGYTWTDGKLASLPEAVINALKKAWNQYLAQTRTTTAVSEGNPDG